MEITFVTAIVVGRPLGLSMTRARGRRTKERAKSAQMTLSAAIKGFAWALAQK